jgi:lysophospholipid acyltransferase (LPLAT)-like uncharacterized protein
MRGLAPLAIKPGSALLRLLTASLRNTLQDEAGLFDPSRTSPLILAIWHNRILCAPALFEFYGKRRRKLTVLTSPSRDGSLLAGMANAFGLDAVRGSSSKNGPQSLRQLKALLDNGHDIVISPDGPRGPLYSIAPGILFLSKSLKVPIAPTSVSFSKYRELKTWDKFRVPHPFTTCLLRIHEPRFFSEENSALTVDSDSLSTLRSALDGNTMPKP